MKLKFDSLKEFWDEAREEPFVLVLGGIFIVLCIMLAAHFM